ncbi:flavin reductase family protein [Pseudonocardia sp. WMMC193]|uniref:flavin reductase family protein n=1 Tax=Pseudonocardia sp. WMMC193 TaxID=2911965 RepID=UPI001F3D6C39|nr:flavin reductase family protein [Pseudonocardia sp. WMMC193]MCF7553281.1 flavin reductase family protein [Pseudonocardia sp. WMMC193]
MENPTDTFRAAMRRHVTGVTVVTTRLDGRAWGMTVSAFTSVCLEPPTVLACLRRTTAAAEEILRTGRFGVSLLAEDQDEISRRCAAPGAPKFLDDVCGAAPTHSPVVDGAVVGFDCVLVRSAELGDHVALFGEVAAVVSGPTPGAHPLLYTDGDYLSLPPRTAA